MAIFTLAEVEEQLTAWKAALLKVSTGQSYRFGERLLTRADLPEIRSTLDWLDKEKLKLSSQGGPCINGPEIMRPA